jgi:hypothetical protein
MVAVPASGRISPSSIRSVVVFPAPLGPRNPVIRPRATVNDTSCTAGRWPNFLRSPATWMAGAEVPVGPAAASVGRAAGPLPRVFLVSSMPAASPPGACGRVG